MTAPDWPFVPLVRLDRGGRPESIVQGALIVRDDTGRERAALGDPGFAAYLRSAPKMIQALPLVSSGAADRFGLEPRHLAVCCASHSGERMHLDAVREILRRSGRSEADLHCGAHPPFHEESAAALVRRGEAPRPIHSDCSGKHAGMIATCVHQGHPVDGYWRGDHPVQRRIRSTIARLADIEEPPFAIDGCGVPTFHVPLRAFALALARFVSGAGPAAPDAPHARRLFDAMVSCPEMVAGTGRFCTALSRAGSRPLLAKGGAEGVYAVAWRDDDGHGVAMVLKAAAGDARGRDFAATEAAAQLGLLRADAVASLAAFHRGPRRNWAGTDVGERVALFTLDGA